MHRHEWVKASSTDFSGTLPLPRSGHSAVNIGGSKIVIFGGLVDKRFLTDLIIFDAENKLWFQPDCTGSASHSQVGPTPRAFHVAVAIDCHMFIFGGRSGPKRLGDFWVLDTDIWQWSELTGFGDLPPARDFAAAAPIGNQKIVMCGGWDGKKWLSDVYVLDTISLEWTELSISGNVPPARCGHTATMVEKRLLVYGGRGSSGIMGDLWALKGIIAEGLFGSMHASKLFCFLCWLGKEENEPPGWTQLKLPGQAPSSRCGHTITSKGHYLLLFGGHGTGGWLSRYDIYYNDCVVLDRVVGMLGWMDGHNTHLPGVRAIYYSVALMVNPPSVTFGGWSQKDSQRQESAISELQRRFEAFATLPRSELHILDELEDEELQKLAVKVMTERGLSNQSGPGNQIVEVLRSYWREVEPGLIKLKELGPLLRDYQRLVKQHHLDEIISGLAFPPMESATVENCVFRYYHVKDASQLRMEDIPNLLSEYRKLLDD
ncbi:hypothetical protein KSS87_015441 [Heliosperma pusillum]|nr:hypothetical protein KSS87_015441 [Heliosperma pusillum]